MLARIVRRFRRLNWMICPVLVAPALVTLICAPGCQVRICRHCAKCETQYSASVISSDPATVDDTIPSPMARLAWLRLRDSYQDVSPQFVQGWKHGYTWAESHQLSESIAEQESLPVASQNKENEIWSEGCRAGINHYVAKSQPSSSGAAISVKPEIEPIDKSAQNASVPSIKPISERTHSFIKPMKVKTPVDTIAQPQVNTLQAGEGDAPAKPQSNTLQAREGDAPAEPHQAPSTRPSSTAADQSSIQIQSPGNVDPSPVDQANNDAARGVLNEPKSNRALAEQMELLQQLEMAQQAPSVVDDSEPSVEWEQIRDESAIDLPTKQIDTKPDESSGVGILDFGELNRAANPATPKQKSTSTAETLDIDPQQQHDLDSPQANTLESDISGPLTPIFQNRNPVANENTSLDVKDRDSVDPVQKSKSSGRELGSNSVLVDSDELQRKRSSARGIPRLIARPISGLIHSKTTAEQPVQESTERSEAKILDGPLFIPPSAIQPLPAAEPIDQQLLPLEQLRNDSPKLDRLPEPVEKVKSLRQAIPANNDLIR